ncbi:MAG: hypothetical protein HY270_07360 [Deltaproteobacteria bacterium]|nr:hypothetical protein [Deltaproteobacteria bacterium]
MSALLCALATVAVAAPDPKTDAKRLGVEVAQGLTSLQDGQRGLTTSVGELRDRLNELRRDVSALHDDVRQLRDLVQGGIDHSKEMREEVRGLYVESSGLKGDIAQAVKQIDTLDQEIDAFRLSSGIIIALVIVLQLALIALTFRGRSGM